MITIKQLRRERKLVRIIARDASNGVIPLSNSIGGRRREHVISLLKILCVPGRRAIDMGLLRAVSALLTYNDKLAVFHLEFSANETYLESINWMKREKKK